MRRNYQPAPANVSMNKHIIRDTEHQTINQQIDAFFASDGAIKAHASEEMATKGAPAGAFVINPKKNVRIQEERRQARKSA